MIIFPASGPAFAGTTTIAGVQTGADSYTPNIPGTPYVAPYPVTNLYQTTPPPFTYPLGGIHFPYSVVPFTVDTTGVYTATSSTTVVQNTTWFLTGTFAPSSSVATPGVAPATPIGNFFVGDYSGNPVAGVATASFVGPASLNLTAGTSYTALIAYNGGVANTFSLALTGPGCAAGAGATGCAPPPAVPISPWASGLLAVLIAGAGGYVVRRRSLGVARLHRAG